MHKPPWNAGKFVLQAHALHELGQAACQLGDWLQINMARGAGNNPPTMAGAREIKSDDEAYYTEFLGHGPPRSFAIPDGARPSLVV